MDNFSKRLLEACASNNDVPEFGKGQQTFIAEKLDVSQEAVRKWFADETVPRSQLSKRLSKLLGVKHSWLMLGTAHGEINTDIKTARRHESSVYALMSFCLGKNVGAAFAEDNAFSDITMIHSGQMKNLSVETARKDANGEFEVLFSPVQLSAGLTIAAVWGFDTHNCTKSASVDFVVIEDAAWKTRAKKEKDGSVKIKFTLDTRNFKYSSGANALDKFLEN